MTFEQAQDFASRLTQSIVERIKRYDESIPLLLFTRYQIESQDPLTKRSNFGNGGSISIDQTEALVCIDISATGGSDMKKQHLKLT